MKITHDKTIDVAYIELEPGKYKVSKELAGGIVVDMSKEGKILGLEIYDASKRTPNLVKKTVERQEKLKYKSI